MVRYTGLRNRRKTRRCEVGTMTQGERVQYLQSEKSASMPVVTKTSGKRKAPKVVRKGRTPKRRVPHRNHRHGFTQRASQRSYNRKTAEKLQHKFTSGLNRHVMMGELKQIPLKEGRLMWRCIRAQKFSGDAQKSTRQLGRAAD